MIKYMMEVNLKSHKTTLDTWLMSLLKVEGKLQIAICKLSLSMNIVFWS